MESEMTVSGSIVDSWLERTSSRRGEARVVLQVAVPGRPQELVVVEAPTALIPDAGWLEDLRGNHCHGSPVAARGRLTDWGSVSASRLHLER
jgi:hypothetical protein